ncbi:alpha/beta-hydrolase [Glonium stellatum]|uniref:Alpha/beta-hydrolase n=1 Tax=Glonium stellatum TaxID=574774 RepID=A0A8E2EYA5_9PEZI|nr:alpha/beta-hydrolase [Glonium stellatum]
MKLHYYLVTVTLAVFARTIASHPNSMLDPDPAEAPNTPAFGSDFTYPFLIHHYHFVSQGQPLWMTYMDIQPSCTPNHQTVMLMHGKNFCGATWNATIHVLAAAGYRVIVPDQIGWCKSSKPHGYQFSLHQLSLNTYNLLEHLGIPAKQNITVIGHSMGGMTATRFALMYPTFTERLVLANPIGLEDWKALGVPYQPIITSYSQELASNYASIRAYEQSTYYANTWNSSYDVWVNMLVDIYRNPFYGAAFAWDMALATDMVFTQPVVYEFPLITSKTLLLIGDKDNTAIGKAWAPDSVKPLLGHYEVLGKKVAALINGSKLIEFADLGHAPQIQAPDLFHDALMGWLKAT